MNTMQRYIFDLDNTLIYTDALNNDAYNYALKSVELASIEGYKRLTREVVFTKYPELNDAQKSEIIKNKQKYFVNNLELTTLNSSLLQILISQGPDKCLLWTSADKDRVLAILTYYKILNAFKKIIISNKAEGLPEIIRICEYLDCRLEHLNFYEDNQRVIQNLRRLQLNVIPIMHNEGQSAK